jgi:hypothetical protein
MHTFVQNRKAIHKRASNVQDELDAQLEAVFGTADINSGKTLTLTEFLQSLQASQIKQLRSRPTMKQTTKQAAAAAAAANPIKVAK